MFTLTSSRRGSVAHVAEVHVPTQLPKIDPQHLQVYRHELKRHQLNEWPRLPAKNIRVPSFCLHLRDCFVDAETAHERYRTVKYRDRWNGLESLVEGDLVEDSAVARA